MCWAALLAYMGTEPLTATPLRSNGSSRKKRTILGDSCSSPRVYDDLYHVQIEGVKVRDLVLIHHPTYTGVPWPGSHLLQLNTTEYQSISIQITGVIANKFHG